MQKLVLLYWGCIFLMYLSDVYYPAERLPDRYSHRSFMWHRADVFMVAVICWMTCFSMLRTNYNDTYTYIFNFRNSEPLNDFLARGGLLDLMSNPLSELYRNAMRELTTNYHIYFFFPAFFSSFAVVKLIRRYSVNPAFSLLIFFSIGTYVMYIAALKQCFATFILLLSIPYAERKQYGRFYLLIFVAMMFHMHAFMFAIVPFLFGKPWGKLSWVVLGGVLFSMATYNMTLGAFMHLAQAVGAQVEEIELFDGHSINLLRVAVYWIPPFMALCFRNRLFADSSRIENLFVNMSLISAFIITMGLVQGANLFGRMAAYFEIATVISLPWMIRKVFDRRSDRVVTFIASCCYFVYFLYEFGVSKGFDQGYQMITMGEFIRELIG